MMAEVLPCERHLAGGHLVEHGAEAEQVAARVELLAAGLLGRHVGHGAHGDAGRGQGLGASYRLRHGEARGLHLGQPEVQHLGLAAGGDEDIGGLDVAMDDAAPVRGVEGVGYLNGEVEEEPQGKRAAGDLLVQQLAFEELHGEEGLVLMLLDGVDGADAGMVQGAGGAGLALEALQGGGVAGQVGGQELEGHAAVQPNVLGLIHHAHATGTELAEDAVVRDGLPDQDVSCKAAMV
jgi:hypothetical protein